MEQTIIKKVSELQPGERVRPHGKTVESVEWFPGAWRSQPGWFINYQTPAGEVPQHDKYRHPQAVCLVIQE